MRRFGFRNRKTSAGKVIAAALVGSAVGATVGLLMAPSSGREMLRRIKGEAFGPEDAQERAKTAVGNVESKARELAEDVRETAGDVKGTVSRRRKAVTPTTEELGL
jgi:gas vesicle protein